MAISIIAHGRTWPPEPAYYGSIAHLNYPQFAWEALRRSANYLAVVRDVACVECWCLPGAPNVLFSRDQSSSKTARNFDLLSFRGP